MGERFSEFQASEAAKALGAEPRPLRDVVHGDGQAWTVGDTTLEVYRDAAVTRVTTPDARIELFRVPEYSISDERVVFEQGDQDNRTRLQVRADGMVAYHPVLRAPERPQTAAGVADGSTASPPRLGVSEGTTRRPDTTPSAAAEGKEPEEQQLLGRLGRDPWYTNYEDQPRAGFPLAVNDDQGNTTWHRVVVFGETAEAIKAGKVLYDSSVGRVPVTKIKKGTLVQVSGTQSVRKEETARGGTRTVTEFHATDIVRMKNPTVPHPQGR